MMSTTLRATAPPRPADAAQNGGRRGPRRSPSSHIRMTGWLFVAPAAVYVGVFHLFPVLYGLVLSFTDYSPISRATPDFLGLDNYAAIFADPEFLNALRVTGTYVLMVLPPLVIGGLLLAILINRPFFGVGFVRAALYIPYIISLTAVSLIWLWMYSQSGFFNQFLDAFGLPEQRWLLESTTALPAAAAMRIWTALGSNMVLLLAGLQSVQKELYEAAHMDGAGRWGQFLHVTLPGIRPVLTFVVAMDIIWIAQGFAEVFVLTRGGPLGSTTTVNYLIWTEAFQYNQMGSASAMAFVLFACIMVFALITVRSMSGRSSR